MRPPATLLLVLLLLAPAAAPQQAGGGAPAPGAPPPRVGDAADLGLPALPVPTDGSRATLRDADRVEVRADPDLELALTTPGTAPVSDVLDKSITGTGFDEHYTYQVPPAYDPDAPPVPMLVAYHGFGSPPASVHTQTLLDELCALHGWFYLAPTGLDDKLFGAGVSRRNTEAVVQHMLDTYAIDADRLYMVGFSMGAGITTNFAATHRDPDGLMIAAVGLVSGSYDWALTYEVDAAVQPWLVNPYNFGTSPDADLFAYQRASGLHHDRATYPPTPGTLLPQRSLAWNLDATPAWVTWDEGDTLAHLPALSEHLVELLDARGTELVTRPVTGTVDPATGDPATHSWAVMDPFELFQFLEGRSVERRPEQVDALVVEDDTVSFLEVAQLAAGTFSRVQASVDPGAEEITFGDGENVGGVTFDMDSAGLAHVRPVLVTVTAPGPDDLSLTLRDDADLPGYLVDPATGDLVAGGEWDPVGGRLTVPVPGATTRSYLAEGAPWDTLLTMDPDPVEPGADVTVRVDSPTGPGTLWMILSFDEQLLPVAPGVLLTVSPLPPAILHPFALDAQGDLEFTVTMPADPGLAGVRLAFQGAVVPGGTWIADTTNPFALDVP